MKKKTVERFWKKIVKKDKDDCWEWIGAKRRKGYGAFWFNKKQHGAHRVMYRLANGDFDKKFFICHTCDNPSCVNPSHLFLGDNSSNMKDAFAKKRINPVPPKEYRFKKGVCYFKAMGERNPSSKLMESDVSYILKSNIPIKELSKKFKITMSQIYRIKRKEAWGLNKHIILN